jgi:hypothetical protein
MSDGEAGQMTEDDAVREQFTGDGIMAVFSAPTWVNWLRMPPRSSSPAKTASAP